MAAESAIAARRVRSHSRGGRRRRFRRLKVEGAAVDSISGLPDVILQHILTFIPTKFAIRTSLLSKRWRHVWCDTPSLSFDSYTLNAAWINETPTRYTAPKMMHFFTSIYSPHRQVDRVRHVPPRVFLSLWLDEYNFPDYFYVNSSVKQLTVKDCDMFPNCSVSWTSLKNLTLINCSVSDDFLANILSGCPILESLTLYRCRELGDLDLSKSLCLRTSVVERYSWDSGPKKIVAPHIHCRYSQFPCTLVDVSSLTEANMNICFSWDDEIFNVGFLQVEVLNMLEKLQHVEKLTFGGNLLQYVIPGIKRGLQNSHDLKKLTVHTSHCNTIPGWHLDNYLGLQGLNPAQCWGPKDAVRWDVESKHLASFVGLVLKNTKTLEKLFLVLDHRYHRYKKMIQILPHDNSLHCLLRLD